MLERIKRVINKGNTILKNGRNVVRRGKPANKGSPRLRSTCPDCNSVNIKRRSRFHDYVCIYCGWKGKNVRKIEYL